MAEFINWFFNIFDSFLWSINSIVGTLLGIRILGVPLLVILVVIDLIYTLFTTIFPDNGLGDDGLPRESDEE